MKQCNYLKHLILLVLCALTLNVTAHEFEAVNSDGVTIWYNITSDNSVEVTYKGSSYSEYSGEYSGEVNIPSTVEYSGNTYSVTSIGDDAFWGCTGLTSVTIPESVTSIGRSAFTHCTGLTSVTIPESVTSIGSSAFRDCTGLTSVTIPESVTSIGDFAFSVCSGLTSVTIPESVTSIGFSAFYNCEGLTSVTIPESVTSIGEYAFWCCDGLTSVTIPESVTVIGNYAFEGCTGLTEIEVAENNTNYSSEEGVLFNKDKTKLIQYPIGNSRTSYSIPEGVTSIGYYAFIYCSGLTSVTIPESVTSIGDGAFSDCTGLTEIEVAENNTNYSSEEGVLFNKDKTELIQYPIGNSRTSYSIPEGVTSIGNYAFDFCTGLTSVTIPESVKSIGGYAFRYCFGLTEIYSLNPVAPTIYSQALNNVSKTIPVYIPKGSLSSYQSAEYWSEFTNFVEIKEIYTISVSSSGESMGSATASETEVEEGATVTLTATPKDGYTFTNWTLGGEVVSADNPYQATITANSWFVANFEEEVRYKTIVQTNNEDWGSVNINGEDGVTEKWILAGNSVTVNAIPEAGYEFVEWSIVMSGMTFPVGGASASYTIPELTADMTLKATFRLTPVPVTSINLSESTVEIRQEKELQLTATLLPNNATNKEVLWSSEDIGIATVDQNGNVTAVSEGTTRIIISAQDGSGVTAECEVTVLPILKGDSNDNEMVTVTDAVNTTNYVAGKEVSVFNYNAADVNSDSNITISDVSGTISIVMAQPIEMLSMQSSIMKNSVSDYLLTDDFVLEGNTPQEVSIKMDNSINYTALQADITTGEGLSICGITLGARADASHRLQTSQLTSSTTRVVIYSLQNRSFKNIDDTLINLQIDSEEGATGDISVSNIYASDNQAQEYILQAIGGANITPTSIQETERQTSSIYSVKGGVIITNSVSKKVSIYSSTGMLIKELYTQSEIEKIELNKGLYIVVVGEKTEKVIVE